MNPDLTISENNNGPAPVEIGAFDVRQDDEACLHVYRDLIDAFSQCERYADRYLNLAAIFFHDLMRVMTGYLLRDREIRRSGITAGRLAGCGELRTFPYIGYRDVAEGRIDIASKVYPSRVLRLRPSGAKKAIGLIGKLPVKAKRVALIDSIDSPYLLVKLISSGLCPVIPSDGKVHIPEYRKQADILKGFIDRTADSFDLRIRTQEIMGLLDNYFSAFYSPADTPAGFDLLLTGSLQAPPARVTAAKARSQGIPVIAVSHGEGDLLIADEPRTGCGELTYPDAYIGYGREAADVIENSKYLKGLYEQPALIPANSNICKKIYRHGRKIKRLSEIRDPSYMYMPTSYVGNNRLGPFHTLPDTVYFGWQKALHGLFPDTIYKEHPKVLKMNPGFRCVMKGDFRDCLAAADVYIFDQIATAFNIACATDRPIIYFDIGFRNIHPDVSARLKKRCIWVDARRDRSMVYLRTEIEKQKDKELVNDYTERYCIIDSGTRREDTIVSAIKNMIHR